MGVIKIIGRNQGISGKLWSIRISVVLTVLLLSSGVAHALPQSPALADTTLTSTVTPWSTTSFNVDSTANIDVGDVLVLDPGVPHREEKVRVGTISGSTITVAFAGNTLQYQHDSGARVMEIDTIGLINAIPNSVPASVYDHDPTNLNNFAGHMDPRFNYNLPATYGPHGNYTTDTNACGRCHQLHMSKAERLRRYEVASAKNPSYGVCTFCHVFNGQSTYDVKNGMIWDTNNGYRYATNGGGFEKMLVVEGPPQVATVVQVSAKHRVDEQQERLMGGWGDYYNEYVKFNAPGGYQDPFEGKFKLRCISCHNPHGTKNSRNLVEWIWLEDPTGYRMQRNTTDDGRKVAIKVNQPFANETTEYNEQIRVFCITCHYDYNSTDAGTKSGSYNPNFYRHAMNINPNQGKNNSATNGGSFGYDAGRLMLPVTTIGDNGTNSGPGLNTIMCLTCHYAHGTFTQVKGIKTHDEIRLNYTTYMNTPGGNETPKNLRMDNRGVCQNCHNRQADDTKPVLTDVLDPAQTGIIQYSEPGSMLSQKYVSATADTITIRFNQYMWRDKNNPTTTAGSVENPGHYNITAGTTTGVVSAGLQPDGRSVLLSLDRSLNPGENVTLRLQAVSGTNIRNYNFIEVNPADGANVITFTK